MAYTSDELIAGLDAAGAFSLNDLLVFQQDGDVKLTQSDLSGLIAYLSSVVFSAVDTESGSNRDMAAVDVGIYWRFDNASPKSATFQADSDEPLPDDVEFHFRCVDADLTLVASSDVTLNPPSGGTLVLSDGMTVTVKRVAVDEFDVIGQTVPA